MKDLSFVLTVHLNKYFSQFFIFFSQPLDQYGTEEECKNRQKYIKLKKKYNLINDQLRKEIVNKLEQEKKSLKEVKNIYYLMSNLITFIGF